MVFEHELFRVLGTVHGARDARVEHGADAHIARLERHVKLGAGEAVVREGGGSGTYRLDFGMGGGVGGPDRPVPAPAGGLPVWGAGRPGRPPAPLPPRARRPAPA